MESVKNMIPMNLKSHTIHRTLTHMTRRMKEIKIDDETREVLKQALLRLSLSARAYHKVIKVAQTIADIAGSKNIARQHVLEALQYRPKHE